MIHIAAGWSLYFKLGEAGTDVDITTHYYEETYPQQAGLGSEVHAADMSGIASAGVTPVLLVGPAAKSGNRRVARPVICNKGGAHTYYVYLSHQTLGIFYLVTAGALAAGQTVVWGTDGVPIAASNDHGTLGGLTDDDHSQYMLLAGRSGGQVAYGGVTGSQNLDIFPNSSTVTSGRVRLYYPQLIDLVTNPTTAGDIFRNGTAIKFFDTAVRKIAPFKDETPTNGYFPRYVSANAQWEAVRFGLNNKISPSIGADQNDWAPTGLSTASVIRVTATGAGRLITGLSAGADGDVIVIENIGALFITLKNESAGSSAANRFILGGLGTVTNPDLSLWTGDSVVLEYDGSSSRWRVVARNISQPSCRAKLITANQTYTTGAFTKLALNGEDYDTHGWYDSTTNFRFQPLLPGKYDLKAGVTWVANATGRRLIYMSFSAGGTVIASSQVQPVTGFTTDHGCATTYAFNGSTDYVDVFCLQTSGGNLDVDRTTDQGAFFSAERVGD